ncbi:MAG: hypothetical protein BAW33_03520 [Desulfobacterales bacterium C00003104]|nr:MAG: hypothetical protein BAW33_03520 [Desulfobacterales bacterium C00003104]
MEVIERSFRKNISQHRTLKQRRFKTNENEAIMESNPGHAGDDADGSDKLGNGAAATGESNHRFAGRGFRRPG